MGLGRRGKDAQVLFMIKKELGFGVVRRQDSVNNTHCYRVRDKNNILKLIYMELAP